MKIEDIKKELIKQKDPIKYLEELLKKTTDKKLIEEIKNLLIQLKAPKQNLENIIRHAPRTPIIEEEKIPRIITTTRATVPSVVFQLDEKKSQDYGIKPGKADYDISSERVRKNLQDSHLVSEQGFTSSAETRQLIDRKFGEYAIEEHRHYISEEQPKYRKFEHVQKETSGLTQLEKEILNKKNKFKPDYK